MRIFHALLHSRGVVASLLTLTVLLLTSACDDGGGKKTTDATSDVTSTDATDATPDVTTDVVSDATPDLQGDQTQDVEVDQVADMAEVLDTADTSDTSTTENLILEPTNATDEYADCLSGCSHTAPLFTVDMSDYQSAGRTGIRGVIDDTCHLYDSSSHGPDTDIIAITAPGRTVLEITVEATEPGALLNPLILTHDGGQIMTFGDDEASNSWTARTVLGTPYVTGLPIFLVIMDSRSYGDFDPSQTYPDCTSFPNGGAEYGYIVRITATPFVPTDLGTLDSTNKVASLTGESLERGGDLRYYTFQADAMSAPTVSFTTANADFVGFIAGMDTVGGQLIWNSLAWDEDSNGEVTLSGGAFDPCSQNCAGTMGEFIFAVSDFNGAAYPGNFTYDLTVSLP